MKLMKRILKNELGQVLPMALVMLVLGGLLVVPTLHFMTTNLNANRQVDQSNLRLYAADAGVEQVLWNIQYNQYDPQENPDGKTLPEDGEQWDPILITVNDREVEAVLSKEADQPYKITSTAPSADGHSTTVECLFEGGADLSWFFDSAVTSATDVEIGSKTVVTGDIVYGDDLDNKGTIDGDTLQDPNLADNWPSASYLTSYYYNQVKDLDADGLRYPSGEITINGTRQNPTIIPRLYRQGDLLLKGGGWARLDGNKSGIADATEANFLRDADGGFTASDVGGTVRNTTDDTTAEVTSYVSSGKLGISTDIMADGDTYIISKNCPVYVTGQLSVNPTGDCVIDLAGQTFFSAYDSGEAIFVGPKTILRGSGCWIAVGNITFNPQLGAAGDRLVGVHYTTPSSTPPQPYAPKETLLLSQFQAHKDGFVENFSILTSGVSGYVKLAMYAADPDTGEPTDRLAQTPSTAVSSGVNSSGLNDITFPKTEVEAGKYYWLAAYSNEPRVCYRTFTAPDEWKSKTKPEAGYAAFTFPGTLTGLTTVTENQYLLTGNALPFVFIMSIEGTSTLQPWGTLYGAIAGDTMVDLQPQCTLTLTEVPEEGLNFPGNESGDDDTTGTPPTIRTYTIK